MPILDFTEIPAGNISGQDSDSFELFARDFFLFLGYQVLSGPDRGADGGRDLILLEERKGVGGTTRIKWLVSCKHKANSKKSVAPQDEQSILDRVASHNCNGFIGFYSTVPSAGLVHRLEELSEKIEFKIFDHEIIENQLLGNEKGLLIARRYFPLSTGSPLLFTVKGGSYIVYKYDGTLLPALSIPDILEKKICAPQHHNFLSKQDAQKLDDIITNDDYFLYMVMPESEYYFEDGTSIVACEFNRLGPKNEMNEDQKKELCERIAKSKRAMKAEDGLINSLPSGQHKNPQGVQVSFKAVAK